MAGVWRKTLTYLGLVEDEELEDVVDLAGEPEPEPVAASGVSRAGVRVRGAVAQREAVVRRIPQPSAATAGSIHRAEPKRFNEARELGEKFQQGVPVIMNLQGTEDPTARRLVDFASGLVFGLEGKIELVANRVYLLTPSEVEVSAEERERLREGGFFNQF